MAATPRVQPRAATASFAGYYFGAGPEGISWGLYVRSDGTGVFLGSTSNPGQVFVVPLTVAATGAFQATGSDNVTVTAANGTQTTSAEAFVLRGQISNAEVTATLAAPSLGSETLSGAGNPAGGPSEAEAGYYVAPGPLPTDATFYALVGPSGQVFVLDLGPGGSGISGTGALVGTHFSTPGNLESTLSFTLRPATHSIAALDFTGNRPYTYSGITDGHAFPARIVAFQASATVGVGNQVEILGFTLGGAGTQGAVPTLIRGLGPALGEPIPELADPVLTLYDHGSTVAANDNWGTNAAQVNAAAVATGAYLLPDPTSPDAGLYASGLAPGSFTVELSGKDGEAGQATAEIYDATANPGATSPRLINLAARVLVTSNSEAAAISISIQGTGARTFLIRAIGPGLTRFGVAGVLAQPTIEVEQDYNGTGTTLASNAGWGGTAELTNAFAAAGAFPLDPQSQDAAVLLTLAAGDYGVTAYNPDNATGIVLVEIYEVP